MPFTKAGAELLTGAMLDRLTHRVHIVEANSESYRLRDSQSGCDDAGRPRRQLQARETDRRSIDAPDGPG